MLERQIVNFVKAVLLLHTINADKNRLNLVLELQRFLIRRIIQCERRTYRVKKALLSMRRSLSRDHLSKMQAAMQMCNDPGDLSKGVVRIFQPHFSRIAAEFQSLKWFVEELAHSMEDFLPAESDAEQMKLVAQPIPADWYSVRDCFEGSDAQTDHGSETQTKNCRLA
jgi:hypothetical protein